MHLSRVGKVEEKHAEYRVEFLESNFSWSYNLQQHYRDDYYRPLERKTSLVDGIYSELINFRPPRRAGHCCD